VILSLDLEVQAIDGRYSDWVGGLPGKSAGDQTQCFGMIRIHVLDDSGRGLRQSIGYSGSVFPGGNPFHHAEAPMK
jgi:hypothetical protein